MQMVLCWHFKEVSVRAQGKTLPQESDKTVISRAFSRRSFSDMGVVAKETNSLVFHNFPKAWGSATSSTSNTSDQKLGYRR